MSEEEARLRAECVTFTRYLTSLVADDYVVSKYVEGHQAVTCDAPRSSALDRALVKFAADGVIKARIADAYARLFRPYGLLRRKLIFVFSILENSRGFHTEFTRGSDAIFAISILKLAVSAAAFVLSVVAGLLFFGPRHLLDRSVALEDSE